MMLVKVPVAPAKTGSYSYIIILQGRKADDITITAGANADKRLLGLGAFGVEEGTREGWRRSQRATACLGDGRGGYRVI